MRWLRGSKDADPDGATAPSKSGSQGGAGADANDESSLVARLSHEDINVRRAAAMALGDAGGEPAVVALLAALWDRRSFVQFEASAALVKIGYAAMPQLVQAMLSPDPAVRQVAEDLLTQIAGPAALDNIRASMREFAQRPATAHDDDAETSEGGDPDAARYAERGASGEDVARAEQDDEQIRQALHAHDAGRVHALARRLCESTDPKDWERLVGAEVRRDAQVVRLAAKALAQLCRSRDVRLIGPHVALMVLEQLEDVRGDHAEGVFRRALGHVSPSVRSRAMRVLSDRGAAPADDDERRLRALVEGKLGYIAKHGPGPITELLVAQSRAEDRSERADAVEQLGKLRDPRAYEALIAALQDDEERVRGAAAAALAQLHDARAVASLVVLLRDRDDWVRCRACDALARLGDARAIDGLARATTDLDRSVRVAAARALATIGGAGVVGPLGEALHDDDVEVRRVAASGLAESGEAAAAPILAAALNDADDEVRAAAARGLGKNADDYEDVSPPAIAAHTASGENSALIAALRSPGRGARKAAAEALVARGWEPKDDEDRALLTVAQENPLGAEPFGEAATAALSLALNDGGHYYLSQTAAEILGRTLDTRAVPALCTALLESTDVTVCGAAATALGRIRDRTAVTALARALTPPDRTARYGEDARDDDDDAPAYMQPWVRPFIVEALGKIGGPQALDALGAVTSGDDEKLAAAIAEAGRRIAAGVDPDRLVAALGDDEPKVGLRAAVLLARRGDPRGMEHLERITRGDDVMLRTQALEAIRRAGGPSAIRALLARAAGPGYDGPVDAVNELVALGEPAARPMAESLAAMEHNGRWTMIQGLMRMGEPAMAALCAVLPGAEVALKKTACEVLGAYGDGEAVTHKPIEPLVMMLKDPDPDVQHLARHALNLLKWKPEAGEGAA